MEWYFLVYFGLICYIIILKNSARKKKLDTKQQTKCRRIYTKNIL